MVKTPAAKAAAPNPAENPPYDPPADPPAEARAPGPDDQAEAVTADPPPEDPQPPAEVDPALQPETAADAPQAEAVQSEAAPAADAPAEAAPPADAAVEPPAEAAAEPAGEAPAADDVPLARSEPGDGDGLDTDWAEAAAPATLEARHIAALGDMEASRYGVYFEPGLGFAVQLGGGHHSEATIGELIAADLAFPEPSGGRHGSAKITDAGRAAYRAVRQADPVEA